MAKRKKDFEEYAWIDWGKVAGMGIGLVIGIAIAVTLLIVLK